MKLLLILGFLLTTLTFSIPVLSQVPTDCIDAVIACGNSNISLDVSGAGNQELNGSNTCSSQENNSVWLKVTLISSGTLGFTLTPNSSAITEDYDFFVFGPNVSCSNIGQAIRCSTTNPQNAGQRNNLTGMNGASTDTSEGPGPNGDSFVRWLDVSAGDTYYIVIDRPIGNSPFSLEWTGTATFSEPPTDESLATGTAINLGSCDVTAPFSDGFTSFDLASNTASIRGSQTDVTVSYHATASDANIGINPLPNTYTNIRNPQTIYARITNDTTGCFELTDFNLNVNLGPDFIPPSDFIICDDAVDGNAKNGRALFDLNSRNSEILKGQNPADFNISYYSSMVDAENRVAPITNPYYNTSPFSQEVFVRIEDALNPNCRSITPLNLTVNDVPDAFNHTLLQCDEDGTLDGLTIFSLNQANDALTGSVPNRSTKFYTDTTLTNEVDGNAFLNTANPQTIYVAVTDDMTGCSNYAELTLSVSLTDSNDTFLRVCDDDGEDGFHLFNLSDADNDIVTGLPTGLTIAYYETYEDALLEQNSLGTTFTNSIPNSQTIYARVENTNECYGISTVELIVNTLPDIKIEDLSYYCLNTSPATISINAAILSGLPSDYDYAWSTGESDYQIQINQVGTYSVTVTNPLTGCTKDRSVIVEASNTASFGLPPFEVKNASENNTITVFVSGEGIYEYALFDDNNASEIRPFQESRTFENVPPGIYFIKVRDIKNDCGTVSEPVSVIGFPKFFTPNNDGINDTWQIIGISDIFQPNTRIQIFNRFGKLLKQLDPLDKGWNGEFNSIKLPADDYWFYVKLQDGRILKNHFTLKY